MLMITTYHTTSAYSYYPRRYVIVPDSYSEMKPRISIDDVIEQTPSVAVNKRLSKSNIEFEDLGDRFTLNSRDRSDANYKNFMKRFMYTQ